MCRYAMHPAKTHWACIPCRYTAKFPRRYEHEDKPLCPACRAPMLDMGREFKAPRKQATAQWEKLRRLVAAGFTFDSCGCGGPGWRPDTLAEAKTALKQRRTHRKHGVKFKRGHLVGRELLDA